MNFYGQHVGQVHPHFKFEVVRDKYDQYAVLIGLRGAVHRIESRDRGLVWTGIGYSSRAVRLGHFANFGAHELRHITREEATSRTRLANERPDLAALLLCLDAAADLARVQLMLVVLAGTELSDIPDATRFRTVLDTTLGQ